MRNVAGFDVNKEKLLPISSPLGKFAFRMNERCGRTLHLGLIGCGLRLLQGSLQVPRPRLNSPAVQVTEAAGFHLHLFLLLQLIGHFVTFL